MKPARLLDGPSAQALGFAWLKEALAPAGAYGERIFAGLRPFSPGEEDAAQARAQRIAAIAAGTAADRLDGVRDALRGAADASGCVARASMGDVLSDVNLLELQRFCDAIERIDTLLAGTVAVTPIANQAVDAVARAVEPGRSGKLGFYLADTFDPALAKVRARLARAQAEFDAVRGRMAGSIARELGRDDLGGDEFIVMRADLRGALPAGVRVQREAPTYVLCALEYDDAALAALERRDAAADAVAVAEESVRAGLSSVVRAQASGLDDAARALGQLDVLVAAARFAQRHRCCVAEIVAQPSFACTGARFLPLEAELGAQGRAFTPIELELRDVAVLTGPNMGGKSVCLQTCGFVAVCAAFGVPVPARHARTSLFGEIAWLGIGAEDELGGLLSSFAKEVVRLRDILEHGTTRLFVLIDEFARTTTPHEGKALLVALLERLRACGARGLLATHLPGVAREAGARHFAVRGLRGIPQAPPAGDLRASLASLANSMDFTIAEVGEDQPPASDAIALAELLGLDDEFVASAYRALHSGGVL